MKKIDLLKNFRQVKFTSDHTLTTEQRHQLILEKLERAERELIAIKAHTAMMQKFLAEERI